MFQLFIILKREMSYRNLIFLNFLIIFNNRLIDEHVLLVANCIY